MILGHVLGKWSLLFSGNTIHFPDPFGFGSEITLGITLFAELIGSCLLILGLLTRISLIPLIGAMAVAVFIVHGGQAFGKIELPLLYLTGFVSVLFLGPGKISMDYFLKR